MGTVYPPEVLGHGDTDVPHMGGAETGPGHRALALKRGPLLLYHRASHVNF